MFNENEENEKIQYDARTTNDLRQEADEALRLYAALQGSAMTTKPESGIFEAGMMLRIEVQGSDTPLLVFPEGEVVLGRSDPASGTAPELDLAPYAAYQMGISRRHAIIRRQAGQLHLIDLGSRNGTYINGKKAEPHQPIKIHDGDEMRLGKMLLRLFFRKKGE
jgi:hypothetical protein